MNRPRYLFKIEIENPFFTDYVLYEYHEKLMILRSSKSHIVLGEGSHPSSRVGGGGVQKLPKTSHLICEYPLTANNELGCTDHLGPTHPLNRKHISFIMLKRTI